MGCAGEHSDPAAAAAGPSRVECLHAALLGVPPAHGASITKENMPQAALHLLQDPVLAASIVVHNAYTKNVFEGGKPALIENFAQELPGIDLQFFRHLTSVVSLFPSGRQLEIQKTSRS